MFYIIVYENNPKKRTEMPIYKLIITFKNHPSKEIIFDSETEAKARDITNQFVEPFLGFEGDYVLYRFKDSEWEN